MFPVFGFVEESCESITAFQEIASPKDVEGFTNFQLVGCQKILSVSLTRLI